MRDGLVTLSLCGDVMTGRGIDQILPKPGDPRLWEAYVKDARTYVELAEAVSGPIARPVTPSWPWGDALRVLDDVAPDARIVNVETSITQSDEAAAGKHVHYRMNPANLDCLTAARPDVCVLANNHVLDFGVSGLEQTLATLDEADLRTAGAGRNVREARRPAVQRVGDGTRVVVFSFGMASSGVPSSWAATSEYAGVDFLRDLSDATAMEVVDRVARVKEPGDLVVASIHWGSNWGYAVSADQIDFAHRLVDGGVDVVHGHSSHHPRPVEVYRGRPILYGCGDLINDYEGITGHDEYRDDLRLLYFASLDPSTGRLASLRMAPLQSRQLRLCHAGADDVAWLGYVLDGVGRRFGSRVDRGPDGMLGLRW